MTTHKPTKEVAEERAKEGGLLVVMRRKMKIHWDRLKYEDDPDIVADYINSVTKDFLKGKELEMKEEKKKMKNEGMNNDNNQKTEDI